MICTVIQVMVPAIARPFSRIVGLTGRPDSGVFVVLSRFCLASRRLADFMPNVARLSDGRSCSAIAVPLHVSIASIG